MALNCRMILNDELKKDVKEKGSKPISRYYSRASVQRPKITTNNLKEIPRRE
jgi:hypothetical protein